MPRQALEDIAMNYVEAGSGPALVFVHGLGGSWADWEYQIPYFASRYRVLVPELRGFGDTSMGNKTPCVRQFAEDLLQFLNARGVERCCLVGHSMGGAVSLQFALNQPARVERLVITNSAPGFRPKTLRQHFEIGYRLLVMSLLGPRRLSQISAERMFPGPEHAALRQRMVARGARNTRRAYVGALYRLTRWSVIERLGEIKTPTLVVGAEHDYFGHDDVVRFAHALPHGALHWFKNARHGLPSEQPDAFNEVVLRFFHRRAAA